ncbi:MAG: M12 family metallo-peptidase [Acidimicrobiales bacterium]
MSVITFGQDLSEHFNKVDVVKINVKDALQKVSESKPVKIGKFELNLKYNDIRSKDFQSKVTTSEGTLLIEPVEIATVKGTVTNEPNSDVRMTIDDNLEGYINLAAEKFYVERADKYDKNFSKDSFVLYKHGDKKAKEDLICGVEEVFDAKVNETRMQALSMPVVSIGNTSAATTIQPSKVMRLATDADYQYFSVYGSQQATNKRILSVLNMVQGMYLIELDIDLQVVLQHVWTTTDPYRLPGGQYTENDENGQPVIRTDGGLFLLQDLRTYWNGTTSPLPITSRDHVNLFTAKAVSYNGLTYPGQVCSTPDYAYGWTRNNNNTVENGVLIESNIAAHELGHVLGADHTPPAVAPPDKPNALTNQDVCFNRNPDQYKSDKPFFCTYTKQQMANHINSVSGCLLRTFNSPPAPIKQSFDYDGDTYARVASYMDATNSAWHILLSNGTTEDILFGSAGDLPVVGDYDGDRRTDIAVFRPSNGYFYLLRSTLGVAFIQFGQNGDIPVQGDYDGDERVDTAIFRPSTGLWAMRSSLSGQITYYTFGQNGDIPVQADYDGDGVTDIAVFRPSNNYWYIQRSTDGFDSLPFGLSSDKLVPADYDGDRKADVAVYRAGNWYIYSIYTQQLNACQFGSANDIPVVGDFDGDGKADLAVKLNGSSQTNILNSSTSTITSQLTGLSNDLPIGFRNPQ